MFLPAFLLMTIADPENFSAGWGGVGGAGSPRHMFGKFIMKLKEIGRPPPFNPSRSTHDQRKFFLNSFAQLYGYVSTSMFRGYTKLYLYDGSHGSALSFTDTDQR